METQTTRDVDAALQQKEVLAERDRLDALEGTGAQRTIVLGDPADGEHQILSILLSHGDLRSERSALPL
ncbi:hypothetical protein [Streptomyces tauricus]|uniref:hypothetical protein n=1 Tax=Streptomyces tauricus TaxID=68274 RepID=UPI00382A12FB